MYADEIFLFPALTLQFRFTENIQAHHDLSLFVDQKVQ